MDSSLAASDQLDAELRERQDRRQSRPGGRFHLRGSIYGWPADGTRRGANTPWCRFAESGFAENRRSGFCFTRRIRTPSEKPTAADAVRHRNRPT